MHPAPIRAARRTRILMTALVLGGVVMTAVPAQAAPVSEAGDLPTAVALARQQHRPVEALAERTESTSTWANPNGSYTTQINGGPVRVRRGDGWVPVDLTLVKASDGSIAPKAHPRGLVLAGAGSGTRDLAAVRAAGGRVALQYSGVLPDPVLSGDTATYREVQPGVDLQVKATRTGFEQFFVVKRRPDGPLNFALPLRATGLTTRTDADGNTQLVTGSGEVVGSLPAAEMWDAKIDARSGDPAAKVKVGAVAKTAKADTLNVTLAPEAGYFADPARAYPVTVDPGLTVWTNFDTFTQSNILNTDQSGQPDLRIGTFDGGATKARSYLHFDASRFRDTRIDAATLQLYATHSYSCSARNWEVWDTDLVGTGTRWANQPPPFSRWASTNVTRGFSSSCAAGWVPTDVAGLIGAWARTGVSTGSMVLKAENESDTFGWKKFSSAEGGQVPHLDVTYTNNAPNPATGLTISDRVDTGGVITTKTLTPTLSFTPSDVEGGALTAVFYVYEGDTIIADNWVWGVPSSTVASWKVPAGLLKENHSYRFRATTFDASRTLADDAWVSLQSVPSGQMADVAGCGWVNGTRVQQWPANGADCQKFFPWGTGDGYYQFRVRHSGQVLDNTGCATNNGNPVTTYDQVYGDCQKWTIEPQVAGTGVYRFAVRNAGKLLDSGCSTTNGTALVIWQREPASQCQLWKLPTAPANGVTVQWLPFTVSL